MTEDPEVIADRFLVRGPAGSGNMGIVSRAEDLTVPEQSPHRVVAVKQIHRSRMGRLAGAEAEDKVVRRFKREVNIMARLDHPNIPRLIDGGVDDLGVPYLAMEYLDGESLHDLASEHKTLPVSWVAAIGVQIAAGLSAAHKAGVTHRDLKPANVMIVRGGGVKVLDFGMGRIVDDAAARITSSGVTVGTARYMAPEQFRESAVGPAADLYALGCMLYELLVGTPPFDSVSAHEVGQKHLHEVVPSPRLLRNEIPQELNRLVEALLRKDPAERPSDAVTVRRALMPFATGDSTVQGWEAFNPLASLPSARAEAGPSSSTPVTEAGPRGMDVFGIHRKLITDYRAFTESGTIIRDERIADFVKDDMDAKSQWPDPWLSLNPFFASGGSVVELAKDGILHEECARIFQAGKADGATDCDGRPLTLHRHQRQAIDIARSGESYVLTTGTGSGKSLAYIVPIVDRVLRERSEMGAAARNRVRAIIVYPMNALANSQLGELDKYLRNGYGPGHEPVTYARYTGQESDERRREIRDNPPDILLTNYVMLELMLTRPGDRTSLIRMAEGLEFLVFDELHTYRGRQGADVALLIRRVREACGTDRLQCIGTSATMASEGSFADQQNAVAKVARTLFDTDVRPSNVIGETLVRATGPQPEAVPADRLRSLEPPHSYAELAADPLARWIETSFGLTTDDAGRLVRQRPTMIEKAAQVLAQESGVSAELCAKSIRRTLEAGAQARHPVTDRPLFAFRLHQFLSKGDTVYVTLESKETRYRTRVYQRVQPGADGKLLMPLAFCRDCGQEYLTVWRNADGATIRYEPRPDTSATGGRSGDGYLYVDSDRPWPAKIEEALADRRLPESWLEFDSDGSPSVRDSYRKRLPQSVTVDPYGFEDRGELHAAFIPAPFMFCLHCGVSYEQTRGRDFAKLATLDQEGRSSATSLISASIVRSLKQASPEVLDERARKLLTFVDNRQDASLQAGHFNDFVQVIQLRGALYQAVLEAGDEGIRHEDLAERAAEALDLSVADYTGSDGSAALTSPQRREDTARRHRLPPLPRSGTRLAGHDAQPGANRAAGDRLRGP